MYNQFADHCSGLPAPHMIKRQTFLVTQSLKLFQSYFLFIFIFISFRLDTCHSLNVLTFINLILLCDKQTQYQYATNPIMQST